MNVKKLKSAIGIVVTWALSLVIPWLYAIQYLYYKLIKRYTKWWDVWKEK